jgi:lysozyme
MSGAAPDIREDAEETFKQQARRMLTENEGLRLDVYEDLTGHLTIGVGRNLTDVGISKEEAAYLLNNDIARFLEKLDGIAGFDKLNNARQLVLLDMSFTMGYFRLIAEFKKMLKAVGLGDFLTASDEILKSLWARQAPKRALRAALMMKTGQFREVK